MRPSKSGTIRPRLISLRAGLPGIRAHAVAQPEERGPEIAGTPTPRRRSAGRGIAVERPFDHRARVVEHRARDRNRKHSPVLPVWYPFHHRRYSSTPTPSRAPSRSTGASAISTSSRSRGSGCSAFSILLAARRPAAGVRGRAGSGRPAAVSASVLIGYAWRRGRSCTRSSTRSGASISARCFCRSTSSSSSWRSTSPAPTRAGCSSCCSFAPPIRPTRTSGARSRSRTSRSALYALLLLELALVEHRPIDWPAEIVQAAAPVRREPLRRDDGADGRAAARADGRRDPAGARTGRASCRRSRASSKRRGSRPRRRAASRASSSRT